MATKKSTGGGGAKSGQAIVIKQDRSPKTQIKGRIGGTGPSVYDPLKAPIKVRPPKK